MSFSIYYEAKRVGQITEQEQLACQEIVERYCERYPFERKVEDFCIYDLKKETDIIFSGATKLPDSEPEFMFDVANYWLKCLTEITHILTRCQWDVTFEEVDLVWDSEEGWCFPTEEEYE